MKRFIVCSVLVSGLIIGSAFAAKRDPDVDKALKRIYPGETTQIVGNKTINGVKVNDVKITTKSGGEAMAQVTDYGDFVMYGVPREQEGQLKSAVQQRIAGLFKTPPSGIDMYRVTNYIVELNASGGKTYEAIFDAVGRLKDMRSHHEMTMESAAESQKVTGKEADDASNWAKKIVPDAEPEGVYKSAVGDNFYTVKLKNGGESIVSSNGQLLSFQEKLDKGDVPEPVTKAIDALFEPSSVKQIWRGEWEFYQFDEQSPTGEKLVIRMRPNGDILRILTPGEQSDEAVMAQHKEAGTEAKTKKKSKTPQQSQ
jgi:hypothetical protein